MVYFAAKRVDDFIAQHIDYFLKLRFLSPWYFEIEASAVFVYFKEERNNINLANIVRSWCDVCLFMVTTLSVSE